MAASAFRGLKNVVLVDGCRLPFHPSGTKYNKLVAYDLARLALTGILNKTGVAPTAVEYCLMGTVIQEAKNQNIARDAGLAAGIPKNVPSHTVTQACISSNQAICTGINLIQTGQADVVVAGGVETMSDVPIKFSKPIRERMLRCANEGRLGSSACSRASSSRTSRPRRRPSPTSSPAR